MKAIEFQAELQPNHTLSVPPDLAEGIPQGQPLRVLILIAESPEDQAWERLTAAEFGQGYADSDAVYDQLSAG